MNQLPLSSINPGGKGIVVRIQLKGRLRHKLMDMGLVQGAVVQVLGIAPLGDPIEIKLKGFNLSLRNEDAAKIIVEPVEIEAR